MAGWGTAAAAAPVAALSPAPEMMGWWCGVRIGSLWILLLRWVGRGAKGSRSRSSSCPFTPPPRPPPTDREDLKDGPLVTS